MTDKLMGNEIFAGAQNNVTKYTEKKSAKIKADSPIPIHKNTTANNKSNDSMVQLSKCVVARQYTQNSNDIGENRDIRQHIAINDTFI